MVHAGAWASDQDSHWLMCSVKGGGKGVLPVTLFGAALPSNIQLSKALRESSQVATILGRQARAGNLGLLRAMCTLGSQQEPNSRPALWIS